MLLAYIQSLVIYLGLAFYMYQTAKKYEQTEKWSYIVIPIFIYSFIFGVRYNVGSDWPFYKFLYEEFLLGKGVKVDTWEPGFKYYTKTCAYLGLGYQWFFGIVAFLQLYIASLFFKTERRVMPYFMIVFMVCCYWLTYANGLRQMMAVSIWFYSIKFIAQKKFIHYFICILLAISMHYSSVILIPFYFLWNKKDGWFDNIIKQYIILAVSLALMKVASLQNLFQTFDKLVALVGYSTYLDRLDDYQSENVSIGVGFLLYLFIHILIIRNSKKIKYYYHSRLVSIVYDVYFVGVVLRYVFLSSLLFSRLNYFFENTSLVMIAFALYYSLKKDKQMHQQLLGLCVLIFIAFMFRAEINSALYIFDWQTDLYYLKANLE